MYCNKKSILKFVFPSALFINSIKETLLRKENIHYTSICEKSHICAAGKLLLSV